MAVNAGPIPGENYTSDTKNYPWRQPPEFTDLDEALDYMAKKLTQFEVANGVLTMVEMGLPLCKITEIILMQGMGEGKWTMDFALLLAGPMTRIIELICIGFEVEYDLGIDDEVDFNTGTFFKNDLELKTPKKADFKVIAEQLPEIKEAAEAQGSNPVGEAAEPAAGGGGDLATQGFMASGGGAQPTKTGGKK